MKKKTFIIFSLIFCIFISGCGANNAYKDLTQWNKEGTINELISYVNDVTNKKSDNFIPVKDRIVVFDLDGTLIGEQSPIYFEWILFSERVLNDPTYESSDEMKQLAKEIMTAGKTKNLPEDLEERESVLFGKAFEGMSTDEYNEYVNNFLDKPADGFDNLTYGECYFRPMAEIITYLEKNQFSVFICSGTDRDADRIMLSRFTDVPMYQVIGSDYYTEGAQHKDDYYLDYNFDPNEQILRNDERIIKNVKSSKIVQMAQELGQKPVLAFGNSTGDISMFEYTTYNNKYKSAAFCVIPDDNEREYAFDNKVEKLTAACNDNDWNIISMKNDFLSIYGQDVVKNPNNMTYADYLLSIEN